MYLMWFTRSALRVIAYAHGKHQQVHSIVKDQKQWHVFVSSLYLEIMTKLKVLNKIKVVAVFLSLSVLQLRR